jgi:hypothetical protein
MKRLDVIKQVADLVGSAHRVDLGNYDLLILIEIYQVRNLHAYFSCPILPFLGKFYSA